MTATLPPRWPQSILFGLFLLLLAWAPLPYASNTPWAAAVLALGVGLLLLFWAGLSLARPERLRMPLPLTLSLALSTLVVVWVWVQTRPDMVGLHPLLTAHPVWNAVQPYGGQIEPTLAIDPWNGRDALLRLLAYLGTFWLAFAFCQYSGRARRLLHGLVAVITAYAVWGLALHFAGVHYVLWEEKSWYIGDVTGTFVNRNNFATYLNLGLIACVGLIVETFLTARSAADVRRLAAELLGKLTGRRSPLLVAAPLIATAMLLTHSRGGMLSGLAALAFLLFLVLLAARPKARTMLLVLGVGGTLTAGLLAFTGEATLARLEQIDGDADRDLPSRLAAYELALRMIADRPWTGHGYGGFEQAFYLYRDARFTVVFDKLHNTFLEHAVELGLPAAGLLYLAPLLLLGLCVRGVFIRRRNQVMPLVAAAATLCVGLHALVDFSLQIPAVGVTYAALLGCGCAQSLASAPLAKRRVDEIDEVLKGAPARA